MLINEILTLGVLISLFDLKLTDDLRNEYLHPEKVETWISQQLTTLDSLPINDRVKLLGLIGAHLRGLGKLDDAESSLKEAIRLLPESDLKPVYRVILNLRFAHVLQWKKEFERSTSLFESTLELCRNTPEFHSYLDFALQHLGKNYFDMEKYSEALTYFEEAIELRKNKEDKSLLESSEFAAKITKDKLTS